MLKPLNLSTKLDIFGGKVFHSIEKCLLHYKRILIAKINPKPSSLKLATWEHQFVLVRLRNGFIAACNVFVCINVVWSDKYLVLVLLSEVSLGNWIFLNDNVRTAIFIRTRTLVPSRDIQRREKTDLSTSDTCPGCFARPHICSVWSAVELILSKWSHWKLRHWEWSSRGHLCHKIYNGSIFLPGDVPHGCASCFPYWNGLVGTKNWANPRRFSQNSSQGSAGFSKPVGAGSKELANQTSVIFMGTLTNLCAWDIANYIQKH